MGDGDGSIVSGGTDGIENSENWRTSAISTNEASGTTECCPLRRQLHELEEKVERETRARRALEEEVIFVINNHKLLCTFYSYRLFLL